MKGHLCQTQSALRGISCCQKAAESKRLGAQLCWKQDLNRKKKNVQERAFFLSAAALNIEASFQLPFFFSFLHHIEM